MSLQTKVNELSQESKDKIAKYLEIKIENKFGMGPPKIIYPYTIINDDIILPFSFATSLKIHRPKRENFSPLELPFEGTLREEQQIVRKEAIQTLSSKGSVIISCSVGWGKCMKINTPIIMYDGTIKAVQDIKVGELLMGDDSTPREVLTTCSGEEQMYDVVPIKGDTFGCNESHILSLKISSNNTVFYYKRRDKWESKYFIHSVRRFTHKYHDTEEEARQFLQTIHSPNIIDISIKEYLKLPKNVQDKLKLYHVGVEFPEKEVDLDPYMLGVWLGDGTTRGTSITNTDEPVIEYIKNYCKEHNLRCRQGKRTETSRNDYRYYIVDDTQQCNRFANLLRKYNVLGNKHIPHIYKCNSRINRLKLLAGLLDTDGYLEKNCYEITQKVKQLSEDICYLARSLGFSSYVKEVQKSCVYKDEKKTGTYYLVAIYGKGLEEIPNLVERKKAVPREQVKDNLVSGFKLVPIEDKRYYGFTIDGNHRYLLGDFTVTHNTACAINLATAINFSTLVIVNKLVLIKQWEESILKFCPQAIIKKPTAKTKITADVHFYIMNAQNVEKMPKNFFKNVGTVIVDEAHMIMAETLSKSLQYVFPRYLIGLTATPYRPDGLDILLTLYFGQHKIIRKLYRQHTTYRVDTGFKPPIEKTAQGRVNWGAILDAQANNQDRNDLIINLIKHYSERNFLVLVKRVEQGKYIVNKLLEQKESVTDLIGSNQEFDKDARILVGTCQKVGVGFDHSKLDALVLATDVEEYFIQYLGRVFRTKDHEPLIFDLVDNNNILIKHFNTRRKVYQDHGGTVKNFDMNILSKDNSKTT